MRMYLFLMLLTAPWLAAQETLPGVEHGVVFFEQDRFAGWPANNGIWSWGDEIVTGFTLGWYKDSGGGHPIDSVRRSYPQLARSLDGGVTWTIEQPSFLDADNREAAPTESPGGIDFSHPDFALMLCMTGSNDGFSHFYYSYDRCKTWEGPFKLPEFGRKGIFARTDYLVNGKDDCMIFLTAAEDWGGEGWPFCARTTDGGKTWNFVGWIGEQPEEPGYSIMPSTVRLDAHTLLSAIRRRGDLDGQRGWWLEMFLSPNNGVSWYLLRDPFINNAGNPASMIPLNDGRIALTYGHRSAPYGIRAMISADQGQTWSEELILRDDAGGWDIGYPRTVQREDGKCVTVYYFHDAERNERFIACTVWDPAAIQFQEK